MKILRFTVRFILVLLHTLFFLIAVILLNIVSIPFSKKTKIRNLSWLTKIWAKSFLKIISVEVVADTKNYNPNENYLIVGNHLSWVDVFIFGSLFNTQFIAKQEVSSWPLIGILSKVGGTIYIDRNKIIHGVRVSSIIAENLKEGGSVVIFPESKSTIGNTVLKFKPSLFLSAIESGKKVLPVTLDFGLINGKKFETDEDKIKFSWFDDMIFAPHFFKFIQLNKIQMYVTVHEPISSTNGLDARGLAEKSYNIVLDGMKSLKK